MTTPHNGNDYERLKEELRRLKRRGAPWYFESALHQRLHGMRKGRARLRPISTTPVIVLAFITLCILALASYVVFVRTNLFSPPEPATPASVTADTVSGAREAVPARDAVREIPPGVVESPRREPRTVTGAGRTVDTALEQVEEPVRDDTVARPVHTLQRADTASRIAPPPVQQADTVSRRGAAAARGDTSSRRSDTTGHPPPVRPPG